MSKIVSKKALATIGSVFLRLVFVSDDLVPALANVVLLVFWVVLSFILLTSREITANGILIWRSMTVVFLVTRIVGLSFWIKTWRKNPGEAVLVKEPVEKPKNSQYIRLADGEVAQVVEDDDAPVTFEKPKDRSKEQ